MQNNLFFGSGYFSKLICNAFDFPDFSAGGRFPELGFKRIFFWYTFTIFFWYIFFVLPVQYIWRLFFISFFFGCLKKKKIFRYLRWKYEWISNIQFVSISKFTYYNLNSFNAFHRVFEWLEIISSVETINFRHIYFHFDGESFSDNHQRPRHDGIHCLVTFNFEHKIPMVSCAF